MLLQSVLVGKACEVYSSLSVEQSTDYELIKREILKAYELVPEAYRQKFRDTRCIEGQTLKSLPDRRKCSSTDGVHHKRKTTSTHGRI